VEHEIGSRPFILLANKADERDRWEIPEGGLEEAVARGWMVLETSAKTGENVEQAFLALTAAMLKDQSEGEDDD
jgi:hypothetical protein